ncbi:MAG: phosphatase PAP2 family protein [Chloroflexi bacterium]|nr:phosphatase PAP2 family protein [Chloroflexota bacterium]
MRVTVSGVAYLGLVAVVALAAYLASVYPVFPGDRALARWVSGLDGESLRQSMSAVSALGDWWPVAIPPLGAAGWLLGARRWRDALFLPLTLAPLGLNRWLKLLVDRPRPDMWAGADSGSFPSSHAVHALAFYGFLFYLATARVQRLWPRRALQALLGLLIVATGISRVYLDAHWPSDVLGGYLVGAALLVPLVWAHRRWLERVGEH